MKALLYSGLKALIRIGFFCYFREIRMHGIENVPQDRPVMLLPNHQNALIDPLLYAAFARGRKPYFLTRSDVFKNPVLGWLFEGLRMMPIYRLRDGRETLQRNQAVFERCGSLFAQGEHILLFPEANHSLVRRVRPLSKGFTRILTQSLERFPQLDIQVLPVGVNYQEADGFPDRVAFYFGNPFSAWEYGSGEALAAGPLKERVYDSLTRLTTHIPPGEDAAAWETRLKQQGVDFLDPIGVDAIISGKAKPNTSGTHRRGRPRGPWDILFRLLNAPVWIPWQWIAANKVPEPEFMSTFRFLFFLLAFPLYYLLIWLVVSLTWSPVYAVCTVLALFAHNLAYVKYR
ncbi:MAG: lysophospholipid acyltransferase family protein [Robiginitalea sp.]|nr:lysophospholipid acyltransferase family protein [Robiginitalea sp.]